MDTVMSMFQNVTNKIAKNPSRAMGKVQIIKQQSAGKVNNLMITEQAPNHCQNEKVNLMNRQDRERKNKKRRPISLVLN